MTSSTVLERSSPVQTVVRATHATKAYGAGPSQVYAIDDVSVDLHAGQFTAIMGPSGSGKSTLLHCMAGLDVLSSGQVAIGDVELASLSDRELTLLRRQRLGFVFQAYNLVPTLTAEENITLPLALAGRRPDRDWLDTVIDMVGLGDRLAHHPSQLSGGQQQRVAVARALVNQPDVIFADEPTGNLDSRSGGQILQFLRDAVDEAGQAIVMVTHDPLDAAHADRVLFLADGGLVDDLQNPTAESVADRLLQMGA